MPRSRSHWVSSPVCSSDGPFPRWQPPWPVSLATRLLFNHFVLPKLIAPSHGPFALNQESVGGFGQMNGGPFTLFASTPNIPNAWIYSAQFVDKTGRPLSSTVLTNACPQLGSGPGPGGPGGGGIGIGIGVHNAVPVPTGARDALQNCVAKLGATYHEVVAFQPASKYWPFQWYELAIYVGVALVLVGACVWWVRRRLA